MLRLLLCLSFAVTCAAQSNVEWRVKLQSELPVLGHRNWIAIVDSAYPLQTSPGIETIETNSDHFVVLREVLNALKGAPHVRPTIYLDAELPFVPERMAHGADQFRSTLQSALKGYTSTSLKHEQIISKLDEAGKTFHILILKTKLTVPYSSIFLQLDCAYWSDEAEKQMRTAMQSAGK